MRSVPPERVRRRAAASSVAPICPHIDAPCVLAAHSPATPRRRAIILRRVLSALAPWAAPYAGCGCGRRTIASTQMPTAVTASPITASASDTHSVGTVARPPWILTVFVSPS